MLDMEGLAERLVEFIKPHQEPTFDPLGSHVGSGFVKESYRRSAPCCECGFVPELTVISTFDLSAWVAEHGRCSSFDVAMTRMNIGEPQGYLAAYAAKAISDRLIEHVEHIARYGEDLPSVRAWRWPGEPRCSPPRREAAWFVRYLRFGATNQPSDWRPLSGPPRRQAPSRRPRLRRSVIQFTVQMPCRAVKVLHAEHGTRDVIEKPSRSQDSGAEPTLDAGSARASRRKAENAIALLSDARGRRVGRAEAFLHAAAFRRAHRVSPRAG